MNDDPMKIIRTTLKPNRAKLKLKILVKQWLQAKLGSKVTWYQKACNQAGKLNEDLRTNTGAKPKLNKTKQKIYTQKTLIIFKFLPLLTC